MTDTNPTFAEDFQAKIAEIEQEANACGLNWTSLCKEAGLSRATPDRWRKKIPKTIEVVTKMQEIIARHKQAQELLADEKADPAS